MSDDALFYLEDKELAKVISDRIVVMLINEAADTLDMNIANFARQHDYALQFDGCKIVVYQQLLAVSDHDDSVAVDC